jgi:2-polyprenyl-3-methyl-5-hydroxy-6-metoxy-1,4-benzoquinol methylase
MATLRNTAIGLLRVAGLTNSPMRAAQRRASPSDQTTAGELKREFAEAMPHRNVLGVNLPFMSIKLRRSSGSSTEPIGIKQLLVNAAYRSLIPRDLAANQRPLSESGRAELEEALRRNYFSQPLNYFAATRDEYLASPEGRNDMADHLDRRTRIFRRIVIPWLAAARSLPGCRILEIGCGTGASTVSLAEQGCDVVGVDVNESNLLVAQERCRIYNLEAEFLCANATDLHKHFETGAFDLIIFFATLEHLTHAERISAMKCTWAMLQPGGLWCVVDTPNRLWWFDGHTSNLPFFHWLPDDLALDYAPHSDWAYMKAYATAGRDDAVKLDFARRGRGVSYHEFDLAIGPSDSLDVVSALDLYLRERSPAFRARWQLSSSRRFEAFLRAHGPQIHRGFYQPDIALIIRR